MDVTTMILGKVCDVKTWTSQGEGYTTIVTYTTTYCNYYAKDRKVYKLLQTSHYLWSAPFIYLVALW